MVLNDYAKNGFTSITSMGITTSDRKVIQLYKHISSKTSTILNRFLALIGILPKREHTVRNFVFLRYDASHLLPSSIVNGDEFFKAFSTNKSKFLFNDPSTKEFIVGQ